MNRYQPYSNGWPESMQIAIQLIVMNPGIRYKEIVIDSGQSARTMRHALKCLRERGFVRAIPSLKDVRHVHYFPCIGPTPLRGVPIEIN